MKILKNFIGVATALVAIFSMNGCEDDFNTLGSGLIPESNFDALLFEDTQISSSQRGLGRVQTNGLPGYLLGVYNDQVYGRTTASILTQLSLERERPSFGNTPELDSVILTIPYFNSREAIGTDSVQFNLDSLYGNGPIKLSVIRSNFFLRDTDPNAGDGFSQEQRYFSDQGDEIENNLSETILFSDENFEFSDEPIVLIAPNETNPMINDTTTVSPRMRLRLPVGFFSQNIIQKEGDEELINNTNFQDFFRGIYIKAESSGSQGSMAFLNFGENSNITLHYKADNPNTEAVVQENETFTLNFEDITVNTFETPFEPTTQDEFIFLRGAESRIAEVQLFEDQAQLDSIREQGWLINEANLTFFVNQDRADLGAKEPERIFVYDLNNNVVLADYTIDFTAGSDRAVNSRIFHLGRLTRERNTNGSTTDDSNPGVSYKIRLTEYIKNIVSNDSTNTRLGVAVSSNVNLLGDLFAEEEGEADQVIVPLSSVLSPESTVLHAENSPNNEKRLKLRIFYTEAN